MPLSWRLTRPLLLATLVVTLALPAMAWAQDGGDGEPRTVVIQGSLELEDLLTALRDAYVEASPNADVTIDPRGGMRSGFEALCNGEVDIVMATEPISDTQAQSCANHEQDFIELVLSYEAVALLAAPEAELTCVDTSAVYDAWQLGAPQEVLWADLGSTLQEPVAFYGPNEASAAYLLFRSLVPAGELREDIITTRDVAEILDAVTAEGSRAFGFMSLAQLQATESDTAPAPLQLRNESGECFGPSVSTLGARTYPLARTDYLYVNAQSAQSEEVRAFLQFVLAEENGIRAIGPQQGYTVADEGTYAFGVNNLLTARTGRTFSRPPSPVNLSTMEGGLVTVVGSVLFNDLTQALQEEFTSRFVNAEVTTNVVGNTQGWQAFCSGEADVLQATRPPTDEEAALCEENGIDPYALDLGAQALVVAVPQANDWLECLDADTAAAMLRAATEEQPAATTWNALNADWPNEDLLLVAPPMKSGETDFLVYYLVGDLSLPVRLDMTESDDPLYRAVGVANTENGLTWLWWTDLQQSEADVRLVAVGADCVAPSEETIADGSYPLGYGVRYYFNRAALENPMVRAFLWHFFDETSLAEYAARGYVGLDVEALRNTEREAVYEMLAAYEEAAAEADAPQDGANGNP